MVVNVKKSKILRFKGGGRRKKISWKWKDKMIEEMKEYKYLGCVSKEWRKRIIERVKRGAVIMGRKNMGNKKKEIWRLGEKDMVVRRWYE